MRSIILAACLALLSCSPTPNPVPPSHELGWHERVELDSAPAPMSTQPNLERCSYGSGPTSAVTCCCHTAGGGFCCNEQATCTGNIVQGCICQF